MSGLFLLILQFCLLRPSITSPPPTDWISTNSRKNVHIMTDKMARDRRGDGAFFPHPLQRTRQPRHTADNRDMPQVLPPFTGEIQQQQEPSPARSYRTLPFQLVGDSTAGINPQARHRGNNYQDITATVDYADPVVEEESRMTAGEMLQLLQSLTNDRPQGKPLRNLRFGFF